MSEKRTEPIEAAKQRSGISLATPPGDRYLPPGRACDAMARPPHRSSFRRRFPFAKRLVVLMAGVGLLLLLVIARCLNPDPTGHGTHRQLGLPPCTFVVIFGKTCPSCGMTTAWAHLVRGEIQQAAAANLGGTLLGATALLVSPWLILSAMVGRWLMVRPVELGVVAYGLVIAGIAVVDWWRKTGGLF